MQRKSLFFLHFRVLGKFSEAKVTKIKPKSKRNHHILLLFDIIHDVEETLIIQ